MNIREGLTYDDVLLVPKKTSLNSRDEADLSTRLSRNIKLNIPIVSANMDTVTESAMAIAMALEGGIGIIHRFLSIEDQAFQVLKVKRSQNIIIEHPYTLLPDTTLGQAKQFMEMHGVKGILIVDPSGTLTGILTNRDVRFETEESKKVSELMTKKQDLVTAQYGISFEEAKKILSQNKIEKLPLVDPDFHLQGLITVKDIIKREQYPKAAKDRRGRLLVGAAIGVKDYLERTEALLKAGCDVIVVDIAHGHSNQEIQTIKTLKENFRTIEIIAGNVATAEGAKDLIEAGADAIKTGVGPGAVCFEESTPILMSDYSVKNIKDVKIGDFVITHKSRPRKVVKTYKRKHKGKILEIKVGGCPGKIKVTPEHPFLACIFDVKPERMHKVGSKYYFDKKKYNRGLKWVDASNLKSGDVVVIPKSQQQVNNVIFNLGNILSDYSTDDNFIWSKTIGFNPNTESHVNLAEKFNTTSRIIGNIVHGGKSFDMELNQEVNSYLNNTYYQRIIYPVKINKNAELDKNLMRLFGYYIAEGYTCGYENNRRLCFTFSNKETEYHQDVKGLVKDVFGYASSSISFKKVKQAATIQVSNHIIAKFFEFLFSRKTAPEKKIPESILNQPKELLREFLIGAIRGDGSIKDYRRINYNTASRNLAFQIAEIFIRLGYMPSINVDKSRKENWNPKYRITISGKQFDKFVIEFPEFGLKPTNISGKQQIWQDEDYIYLSIDKVETVEDELDVYNIEIEEDNSYIANRIAVHNCSTRIVSGAGVPQLTAVLDCVKVAKEYDIPVNADGGIQKSGDIAKALAAGAESVMIGSLFAGTDESPGVSINKNGRKYKFYRGMASFHASVNRQAKETEIKTHKLVEKIVPEGVESLVPYTGNIKELLTQLMGGLKSGMSYCGAKTIKELHQNAEFIRITWAGLKESHPHDVEVVEKF